jgi:hypothetical protein
MREIEEVGHDAIPIGAADTTTRRWPLRSYLPYHLSHRYCIRASANAAQISSNSMRSKRGARR